MSHLTNIKSKLFSIEELEDKIGTWRENGDKIIENYQRFLPDLNIGTNWIAIFYVLVGILLILGIDYYGRKRKAA